MLHVLEDQALEGYDEGLGVLACFRLVLFVERCNVITTNCQIVSTQYLGPSPHKDFAETVSTFEPCHYHT